MQEKLSEKCYNGIVGLISEREHALHTDGTYAVQAIAPNRFLVLLIINIPKVLKNF